MNIKFLKESEQHSHLQISSQRSSKIPFNKFLSESVRIPHSKMGSFGGVAFMVGFFWNVYIESFSFPSERVLEERAAQSEV